MARFESAVLVLIFDHLRAFDFGQLCVSVCTVHTTYSTLAVPSMSTSPLLGERSPTMSLMSVDLPQPLRPSSAMRLFAVT